MPCKFPIHGWRAREKSENGKRGAVYRLQQGYYDLRSVVPCGQCTDCRLDKSREWAIRCVHESKLYEENCVVTLTYSDDELDQVGGTINPDHAEQFMKKLRERERYKTGKTGIRSYGCAEYGCRDPKCGKSECRHTMRPHYHIILFNHHFEDRIPERKPGYYTSESLTDTWGRGMTQVMDLTFESAAYVARYVMKKLTGPKIDEYKAEHIELLNTQGCNIYPGDKLPEQPVCISRDGGIGKKWYEHWKEEIYKQDKVFRDKRDGQRIPMRPPKYYDKRYEIENPEKFQKIKARRKRKNMLKTIETEKEICNGNYTNALDGFGSRQKAYIDVQEAQMKQLKRGLENES